MNDLETAVPRHQFSLGIIASSLALVVCAGTSLRRTPVVVTMQGSWSGVPVTAGSYHSVRLWLLRLGLYQLSREKEQADDWMWIIDHTLQLGDCKSLIILGIRRSTWDQNASRVLNHEDVELIDLQPVTESNGKVVARQLEAAAAKTGYPCAIISDKGSDLHSGIALFCQKHKGTRWVYDVKHMTACLLKRAFQNDRSWGQFVDRAHRFKLQVAQTALAGLGSPQQRSKARYMNADVLIDWATCRLRLLNSRQAMRQGGLKPTHVEQKLGWLRKYETDVARWNEMMAMVEATEHYVRHEGYHGKSLDELKAQMSPPSTRAARALRQQLLECVGKQAEHLGEQKRLLGSSEVIESVIGRFKHMAGERGHHGMTGMVLSVGAFVGRCAINTVQSAMEEVTTHDVWKWCHEHLGATVQSVRRRISQALASEQK